MSVKDHRILFLSNSPTAPTGFGTIVRYIATGLKDLGWDIRFMSWDYTAGKMHDKKLDMEILPVWGRPFGRDQLSHYIRTEYTDLVMTLSDIWMTEWMRNFPRNGWKWLSYFPLDSEHFWPQWKPILKSVDYPVCFSKFAKKLLDENDIKTDMIYHGVDTKIFKPLTPREKANIRAREFPDEKDPDKLWIVGAVGRNQIRKMQPYMIRGFAEFAKKNPDARIVFHCDLNDQMGWSLGDVCKRYDCEKQVMISKPKFGWFVKFNTEPSAMNDVYNYFDVHMNTANEGFGLPIIESMAAGIPNIVGNCTTGPELVGDNNAGMMVDINEDWVLPIGIDWKIWDTKDCAYKLQIMKDNPDKMKMWSENGIEFAKSKDWSIIMKDWDKLLKEKLE